MEYLWIVGAVAIVWLLILSIRLENLEDRVRLHIFSAENRWTDIYENSNDISNLESSVAKLYKKLDEIQKDNEVVVRPVVRKTGAFEKTIVLGPEMSKEDIKILDKESKKLAIKIFYY